MTAVTGLLKRVANERTVPFAMVGVSGLVVNTAVLAALVDGLGIHYLLGVLLATQVSTLWNFLLNDRVVFGANLSRGSAWMRYLQFAVINNAALLLRGPIVVLLTGRMGVNYLVSNLISLGFLFAVRFVVADSLIWRDSPPLLSAAGQCDVGTGA